MGGIKFTFLKIKQNEKIKLIKNNNLNQILKIKLYSKYHLIINNFRNSLITNLKNLVIYWYSFNLFYIV